LSKVSTRAYYVENVCVPVGFLCTGLFQVCVWNVHFDI